VVLGGSVITPADAARLRDEGVAAVFGPGTAPPEILATIRALTAT
jgi:methylmalonyl-CoA mutase cobalamin-binding domain/chain